MNHSPLNQGAIDAIVGGYHGAPFDILGPHLEDGNLVIRAFWPDAEQVAVVSQGASLPMNRIHDSGLFEVTLPNRKKVPPYQLNVTFPSGLSQLYEDPYAFAPTLS